MVSLEGRDILAVKDFTREEITKILDVTDDFIKIAYNARGHKLDLLQGKVLATLFFSPSTRTQFAFQSAMLKLGGGYVGFSGIAGTSYARGEAFEDGIRMYDSFADIICIRHPEPFSAADAARVAEKPVINCGDGTNEHPTDCFHELSVIRRRFGKLEGKTIVMVGDLKSVRTAHSLSYGCAIFDMNMIFAAPKGREMPEEITKELKRRYNAKITEIDVSELKNAIKEADILYEVPVLPDFFKDKEEYERCHGTYKVDLALLREAGVKDDFLVLHPLPRHDELARDIDATNYAGYWEKYRIAIPQKMALLSLILGAIK